MKLLFDENLSDRLVPALAELFPGSSHVKALGLMQRPDGDVWTFAKRNDFVIVTKDTDFLARSILEGAPPKVLLLRLGNGPTTAVRGLLRAKRTAIEEFALRVGDGALVLDLPETP